MFNNFSNQTKDYYFKNTTPYGSDFNNNDNHNNNLNAPIKNANNFLTTQNCRLDIIGELDAIIQYERHLSETDDPVAKATILNIVNEEKLHVGQLMGLLFYLDPTSKKQFEKGFNEFMNDDRR